MWGTSSAFHGGEDPLLLELPPKPIDRNPLVVGRNELRVSAVVESDELEFGVEAWGPRRPREGVGSVPDARPVAVRAQDRVRVDRHLQGAPFGVLGDDQRSS